jgi:hypothetical protein
VNGKNHPFLEFEARAIFDPQVDFLYVNELEFTNLMRPVIKQIYSDDINCSDTDCFFSNPCPKVKDQYHHAALSFTLGTEGNEYE